MSALKFTIDVREPAKRRIEVALELELMQVGATRREHSDDGVIAPPLRRAVPVSGGRAPAPEIAADQECEEVELFAPTWTPGSYLIREFARHLGLVRASDATSGAALACRKIGKNRYRIAAPAGAERIAVHYSVYAHELTVRTADLTNEHAYWNHACVLLWPVARADVRADVEILLPTEWDCVAGLPLQKAAAGRFRCDDVDLHTLVDAPVLAGTFARSVRTILGVEHVFAFDGLGPARIHDSFLDHAQRIVETAAQVFGGTLPYPHYTVLGLFADSGYGGLEHANSTTLLSPRTALLRGRSYQEFLGLFAHELFHAWNVKRMRPAELWDYDYEVENHTQMLWLAEGWTAYYDDLICRRARLLSAQKYLGLVAKNLANLWAGVGRLRLSLAESSHDAWIRHYRPDENTRNSTQNYYGNGALAALILDLTIRRDTRGQRSLDDALAMLYRTTFVVGRGYRYADVVRCLSEAAGHDMGPLLASLTLGPLDPDFAPLLAEFGVALEPLDRDRCYFGFAFDSARTTIASVADDSPAHAAGLAPGDEVLAIAGLRATSDRWADLVESCAAVGKPVRLLVATRGIVSERTVTPAAQPRIGVSLTLMRKVEEDVEALRRGWLGDLDEQESAALE